jgi:hypothetical protein
MMQLTTAVIPGIQLLLQSHQVAVLKGNIFNEKNSKRAPIETQQGLLKTSFQNLPYYNFLNMLSLCGAYFYKIYPSG